VLSTQILFYFLDKNIVLIVIR